MATPRSNETKCSLVEKGILELEPEGYVPDYRGLVVSADTLMVLDYNARNLRLYRLHDGKLLATSKKLKSEPRGICLISNTKIAVILWNCKIEIMLFKSTGNTGYIRLVRTLDGMTGFHFCDAVAKVKSMDKCVISCMKLGMMYWGVVSLKDGHVDTIHQICTGRHESHLAIKYNIVYISCWGRLESPETGVYAYDIHIPHTRKFLYQHSGLKTPTGITVDTQGFIFVCNRYPRCIYQLTDRGELVTVHTVSSWSPTHSLRPSPRDIFYEVHHGMLYITSVKSNKVMRYRLEYSQQQDPVIPAEVLKMDVRSLQMYKEALRAGKEKVYSIRVMVVGQYGVGKTTLTKRLLGKDVTMSETDSTDGIDVHTCKVSSATRKWTTLDKNAEQYSRLQRLVKLLNECVQKQESEGEQKGQSVTDNLVATGAHDNGHPQLDQAVSAKRDINEEIKSTFFQAVELPIDHVVAEASSVIEPNEYEKDAVMEILQLVNENSDKLDKNMVDYAALALWDFAGQYVFYTTHQTFLTSRAIYLLVIDLTQQVTGLIRDDECFLDTEGIKLCKVHDLVEIWLNSIHSCARSHQDSTPPVILVGTHVDKIPERFRQKVVDKYFMKLRDMLKEKPVRFHLMDDFAIDNTQCDPRLEELKSRIYELASEQTYWGEEKPARWLPLEQAIMKLKASGVKVATLNLVEEINRSGSVRIEDKEELDLFLRFQHETGMILYFSVEGLREKIVLDPQWLIDALKSLITSDMFMRKNPAIISKWFDFRDKGILSQELIDVVWTKERYPELHANKEHILLIMEQLHIIAKPRLFNEIEEKVENYFLAPCMLRETTPREIISPKPQPDMNSSSVLCYVFMGKFLPCPIFHRLLAVCVAHWPVAKKNSENLIFCGCCVFRLDLHHRLTVFFREHVIFVRVTRMGTTKKIPSSNLCIEVKEFITMTLSNVIGYLEQSLRFELYIQCPKSDECSVNSLIPVADLKGNVDVPCHCHDDSHVIMSCEVLKFWFQEEQMMDSVEAIYSRISDLTIPEESYMSLQRQALPPGKKYHAFFSYSSSDIEWVRKTVKTLEEDHGFVCCEYDRDNTPGTPLMKFADDSIRNAHKVVVVMTKEAFESHFVLHEIQMAINYGFNERRNCVVPVLLEDCEVPSYLSVVNYVDARDIKRRDIWWPKLLMEMENQDTKRQKRTSDIDQPRPAPILISTDQQGTLGSTVNESVMEEKQTEAKRKHYQLCLTLYGLISEDSFQNIKQMTQVYLDRSTVEKAKDMRELWSCLEEKGIIGVGKYDILITIMTDAQVGIVIDAIRQTAKDIKEVMQICIPPCEEQSETSSLDAHTSDQDSNHSNPENTDIRDQIMSHHHDVRARAMNLQRKLYQPKGVSCSDPKLLCQVLNKSMQVASSSKSTLEGNCLTVGLKFHGETPANGNCFFEAVSSQLQRLNCAVQKSPQQLRQDVVAFMKTNRILHVSQGTIDLADFMDNETFDDYCLRMANDGEWADHVVVVAMARKLQTDIMIITSSPSTGPDDIIVWVVGQTDFQGQPILLGHVWEYHYQSLQPIASVNLEPVLAGSPTPAPTDVPTQVQNLGSTEDATAGSMSSPAALPTLAITSGTMLVSTYDPMLSVTADVMQAPSLSSTHSTTVVPMHSPTSSSTAPSLIQAPAYGSTQSMTTGPMVFPTFNTTTADVMQTVTSSFTTAGIMQAPASGYTPSTTAGPIPAPTSTSTASTTAGHMQSATSTSTAPGLMPAPTYGSTQSTTTGSVPSPTYTSTPSTTAGHIQGATSTSTAAGLMPAPTYGSTQSMTTGPMPFPTFSATTVNVMQTVTSSTTTADIMQAPASGYTPSTTAGPIPAPTSTSTASTTAGHMQSATSTSTAPGLMPAPTYGSTQSTTTGSVPSPTYTSTPSTTAGHIQGATSTSTAAGLMPAPTYGSTQSMTTGPMPFPTFSATTVNVMQTVTSSTTTADIMQAPASGYTPSTTAGPIPAPTSTSTASTTAGHMQSATSTSTAPGLMPAPTYGSTQSTTTGSVPSPTYTSTPSTTAGHIQGATSTSTAAGLMPAPTYGSTQSMTTGPMPFPTFSATTVNVMQTVTSSTTTADIMQAPASGYTPSTTAGPIPAPTSTSTASTTAGHMQSATSTSTAPGLMPAPTYGSTQSTTTGSMPSPTYTSTPSTTAGHMQGATSTSTAAGLMSAPTYGSTQTITPGPMPFPIFSATTADIMQAPASGYTPSTTAGPIPAPTSTSTPSPTGGHMQSATSTSTAAGLMPAPASGSIQSTTTGSIPSPTSMTAPTSSSTTADVMQAPKVDDADRFMHIACLLVNVGSRVLRRLLFHHTVTPTCTLDQYLANNRIAIDSLKKRKILNKSQMDILFPPGGSTNLGDYDITLLSALFNNIVSTITQQQWNMIQFLRDERNKIFAHARSITVNVNDYQKIWNDIWTSLVALCKQCGDPDFENEILKEIQGIQMSTVQGTTFLDTLQTHPRRLETLERLVQALISGLSQVSTKPSDDSDS